MTKAFFRRGLSIFLAFALCALPFQPFGKPQTVVASSAPSPFALALRAPALGGIAQPTVLADGVTVWHEQSAFTAVSALGNTLVVTWTVMNTRLPSSAPALNAAATITDKLNTLANFVSTDDPNTLRSVLLVNSLTANATLLGSSRQPEQQSGSMAFMLGDLAPQASVILTMSLQVPAASSGFLALDTGAVGYGSFRGRMMTGSAGAVMLAPDSLGAYLIRTMDADTEDEVMLGRLAALPADAGSIFEYVRDLRNEVYAGSLRGTRGALWGGAANALDKSSLLIAMLRARSIPARYRHGSLSAARAQEIIASMFPSTGGVSGSLAEGAQVSDPLNDATLLAEASDHWWVEAYVPGTGWTNFDPSFASASAGQTFHAGLSVNDQVGEVPDTERHKITVWLEVERYNVLSGLTLASPLTHTFRAVELSANPLMLGHFVESSSVMGLVFGTNTTTYRPYFVVGTQANSQLISGESYQDLASSFGGAAASVFHTGAWLKFQLQKPNGATQTLSRPLADRLGADARLNGGTLNISSGDSALFSAMDSFVTWFYANDVPEDGFVSAMSAYRNRMGDIGEDTQTLQSLNALGSRTPAQEAQLQDVTFRLTLALAENYSVMGLNWAYGVDSELVNTSRSMLVKNYYTQPRIVTVGASATVSGTDTTILNSVDLRRTSSRVVAFPGQDESAAFSFNWIKGLTESVAEGQLLGEGAFSVARLFDQARAQNIPTVAITARNLDELDGMSHSAAAKALMVTATLQNKIVIVPAQPISMNGKTVAGWYEVDLATGETMSVMENGLHVEFLEYKAFLFKGAAIVVFIEGLLMGIMEQTVAKLLAVLGVPAPGTTIGFAIDLLVLAEYWVNAICGVEAASMGPEGAAFMAACTKMYWAGAIIGKAIGEMAFGAMDPPVPGILMGNVSVNEDDDTAYATLNAGANLAGSSISANLHTAHVFLGDGTSSAAGYAPALSGLGVGSVLSGSTLANFAASGGASLSNGQFAIAASAGSFTLNGAGVSAANGLGVDEFSGAMTLAENSASLDALTLTGAGNVFGLALSSASSSINPTQASAFDVALSSSVARAYTLTAFAPDGWGITVTASGRVTVTPPLGETAGEYVVLLTAQPHNAIYAFASAIHTVTLTAYSGMQMSVSEDSLTTVTWGEPLSGAVDGVSNGQVQMPGAAYDIRITNTSQVSHTFQVNVSGLPAGWVVLPQNPGSSTAIMSLGAGEVGVMSFYISPTSSLPPAGAAYGFGVSATALDVGGLSMTENKVFTVASAPYAFLGISPEFIYASPNSPATFLLNVMNVGNAAGAFALTPSVPAGWGIALASPLSVAAGADQSQSVIFTPTGSVGEDFTLTMLTHSGAYSPSASTLVRLTTPMAACVYRAGYGLLDLGEAAPTDFMDGIAYNAAQLENDPTSAAKRDALANAMTALLDELAGAPTTPAMTDLDALAAEMQTHTSAPQITAGLQSLCAVMGDLSDELRVTLEHDFDIAFTPGADAALPGRTATTTLMLTNHGAASSAFNITITSPALGSPILLNPTLAAGASFSQPVAISLASAGFAPVYASATAHTGNPVLPALNDSTIAGMSFVSPVVGVLSVLPSPAFVDTGTSAVSVSANVANLANWRLTGLATLNVIAPSGAVSATATTTVSLSAGDAASIGFGSINTSGYATGTYTLTVSLVVSSPTGLAGAASSAYGFLGVGQALFATGGAYPQAVAPGFPTVTTIITTLVSDGDGFAAQTTPRKPPAWLIGGEVALPARVNGDAPEVARAGEPSAMLPERDAVEEAIRPDNPASAEQAQFAGGLTRAEVAGGLASWTGTWANVSGVGLASGGSYSRSSAVSSTLSFTFTGSWVSLGYLAGTDGRYFEVFLDGASLGVVDSYANATNLPQSRVFGGLVSATHVISVVVLGGKNAFASVTAYAKIDYFDTWDGSTLSDGVFEHTDGRVILGTGWTTQTLVGASGGSYGRSGTGVTSGVAWFAFTGDSVSYTMLKNHSSAGMVSVYVDGGWKTDVDLYTRFSNDAVLTSALSFDGLGGGAHVLTLVPRKGTFISLDTFAAPGNAPFYSPPGTSGLARYQENNPAVKFNGAPIQSAKTSWTENNGENASGGYYATSSTLSDTVSMTFTGQWVNLGYIASTNAGKVEVFIDGVSQGALDTYEHDSVSRRKVYGGLSAGSHTISVTHLGTRNAYASSPGWFYFDYFDVWDGSALADGSFEEDNERVLMSRHNWNRTASATATGGYYSQLFNDGTAWFAFTGDSASVTLMHEFLASAGVMEIFVDGVRQARIDLGADITGTGAHTQVYSFGGFGAGAHVMSAHLARGGYASLDSFASPATTAFYAPPARAGIVRYEEHDPAVLFNNTVYTSTKTSWAENSSGGASDGYTRYSSALSDTVALAFNGSWVSLGYLAATNGGRAEIFVDGASQGILDTYGHEAQPRSVVFGGLGAGSHTISVTALGARNSFASAPGNVNIDYFDVWDGSALTDGSFDETGGRALFSPNWSLVSSSAASGGVYARNQAGASTVWLMFAGDSITYNAMAGMTSAGEAGIWVDGRWLGYFDLSNASLATRVFSFGGFGAGAHVMTIITHRGSYIGLDGFVTPGVAPFHTPARSGVYRLEEDDPALAYNGAPFTQTKTTWLYDDRTFVSDGYVARSSTTSDTVSLTFGGKWAAVGFATRVDGRHAEVFLDGVSQGVVDTYSATDDVTTRVYDGLVSGTHTISVAVLSTFNVSATGGTKYVYLDYFDVWDGTTEPKGIFQHEPSQQDGGRMYVSNDWSVSARVNTISGTFVEDGANAWFLFSGVSVTVIAVTDNLTPSLAEVFVDGVSQGVLDLSYENGRTAVPYTFAGLSNTAHVVRVVDRSGAGTNRGAGLDAFQTGGAFEGSPMVEWSAYAAASNEYFDVTSAVGDLNGDGMPEIVTASSSESCIFTLCTFSNKALYVFDGADGGLIFSRTITGTSVSCTGGVLCAGTGSPAIANLDGGDDIEIVVDSSSGLRAFKNDGAMMWINESVKGTWASAVAIGNMDADEAPEIVAAHDGYSPVAKRIHIVQPDGSVTWSYTLPTTSPGPRVPTLADFNNDGLLDILIASGQTLYLFHNNGVSMTLAYTQSSGLDHYGAPAVADLDDDGLPEIVAGWTGVVQTYEHDLTPKWAYTTGGVYPSTISVADLDGDDGDAPEIVLYSKTSGTGEEGRVFVLNHDGTLLWSHLAKDTTNSSAGVAVLDLDGDGAWEVVWNGYVSGTLIFKGSNGDVLFNDDTINSGTINETPVIADIDNDGHAEILLVDGNRIVSLGFDAGWAEARDIWNQHGYHITNVNDDLTAPTQEPGSWGYHNTYRTQSPLTAPAPVYYIEVTHTVANSMSVNVPSFTVSPTLPIAPPVYEWGYRHYWYQASRVAGFTSVLSDVLPGELRKISEGTLVSYTVGAGSNVVAVPPLFVMGAHIVTLDPTTKTVNAGSAAAFQVALNNPSASADVYTLTLGGLPGAFAHNLPATLTLAANSATTLSLAISAPTDAALGGQDFVVNAQNSAGGQESVFGQLNVALAARMSLAPAAQSAQLGETVTYTLRITNEESVARVYSITVQNAQGNPASHAASLAVAANSAAQTPVAITASQNEMTLLFAALVTETQNGVAMSDEARLDIFGRREVTASISPAASSQPNSNAFYLTLTLTNTGSLSDVYDLELFAPAGWSAVFERSESVTDAQLLAPYVFNAVSLRVRLNANGDPAGMYPLSMTARSRSNAAVSAVALANVTLVYRGVYAEITPSSQTATPNEQTSWTLYVENLGNVADTFVITGVGELAGMMAFGQASVTLPAFGSANVALNVGKPAWALPGTHLVGALVKSQSMESVATNAQSDLNIVSSVSSTLSLAPQTYLVSDASPAYYMLTLTNTGNVDQVFALGLNSTAAVTLEQNSLALPAGFSGSVLVMASATAPGAHPITVTATSEDMSMSAAASLRRARMVFVPNTLKASAAGW